MAIDPEFYAPERVLVIVAHADDIEFGIGGTIARWTDAGTHVTYCNVTDNGSGSNDPAVKRADLVATREAEQRASAAVVGVSDVRFLGYPDGMLQPTLELRRDLTRLIREIRPQVVVTMDPTMAFADDLGYINHPDHRAVAEAAVYAVFPSAGTRPIFPELLDEGFEPHNVSKLYLQFTEKPNLVIDVTDYVERKIDALRCHKSQVDEQTLEMVRGWGTAEGAKHGVGAVESFRVLTLEQPAPKQPAEAVLADQPSNNHQTV